jgi:hypothetical protein
LVIMLKVILIERDYIDEMRKMFCLSLLYIQVTGPK